MEQIEQDLALIQEWKTNSSSIDIWAANRIMGKTLVLTPQEITPELMVKMESLCRDRKENLQAQQELEKEEQSLFDEYKQSLVEACQDLSIFEQTLRQNMRQFRSDQQRERVAYLCMLHPKLDMSQHAAEQKAELDATGQLSLLVPGELFPTAHWLHLQKQTDLGGELDAVFQDLIEDAKFVSQLALIRKYESNQQRAYQQFCEANDAKRQKVFQGVQKLITDARTQWAQFCQDKPQKLQQLKEEQERLVSPFPARVFEIPSVWFADPIEAAKLFDKLK